MIGDSIWYQNYLKALCVRADMIEKYGGVSGWLDNFEEYKQRLAAAESPSLEECDTIVGRLKRLVEKGAP